MKTYRISKETIIKLNKLSSRRVSDSDEEFIPYDAFGGNMDDAYYGGRDDGETDLASEILLEIEEVIG